ncbi:MAG TPA: hypothetical protein VNZ49_02195 [Bacteroidia bacterium]|jgi:hypothetical protein|nr:hypothetical protein [Bacteroidia bacterium]
MTNALKKVFSKLDKLPVAQQNAIASLLSEELTWQKSFENSQDELLLLASEAVVEYKKGKTQALNLK